MEIDRYKRYQSSMRSTHEDISKPSAFQSQHTIRSMFIDGRGGNRLIITEYSVHVWACGPYGFGPTPSHPISQQRRRRVSEVKSL